jgi:Peptidase S24-like
LTHKSSSGARAGCELIAEALKAGHEVCLRVTGTSMLPAVRSGDIVRVRPSASAEPGEIVLFAREGRFFAHRVTARRDCREGLQLLTRGDALPAPDLPVHAGELLGTVVAISRGGRGVPVRIGATSRWVRAASLALRRMPTLASLVVRLDSISWRRFT